MKKKLLHLSQSGLFFILLALPASTNYEMHDFGFGSGGSAVMDSTNYSAKAITGEISGSQSTATNYDLAAGLEFVQQANVPAAPTFTNPASYYNKLKFVLDTGNNPSDTVFAIAISTDNFTTTNYIQADNTIGSSPVYQTYATWGGATGANVIGLATNTTYKIKTKAMQTKFNESGFSAVATATTEAITLSYDLDVSASDSETAAPYIVSFGTLSLGSVTTSAEKVWVDLDTNAENGAFIYAYANNAGLTSASSGYTITSATADLSSANEGYGLQIASVTQSAGGPLTKVSPYNGATENVGIINTVSRNILTSSNAPITAGRASIYVKAKASTSTPAASDFSDVLTMIASSTF